MNKGEQSLFVKRIAALPVKKSAGTIEDANCLIINYEK